MAPSPLADQRSSSSQGRMRWRSRSDAPAAKSEASRCAAAMASVSVVMRVTGPGGAGQARVQCGSCGHIFIKDREASLRYEGISAWICEIFRRLAPQPRGLPVLEASFGGRRHEAQQPGCNAAGGPRPQIHAGRWFVLRAPGRTSFI